MISLSFSEAARHHPHRPHAIGFTETSHSLLILIIPVGPDHHLCASLCLEPMSCDSHFQLRDLLVLFVHLEGSASSIWGPCPTHHPQNLYLLVMSQCGWAMGHPDIWSDIILSVPVTCVCMKLTLGSVQFK